MARHEWVVARPGISKRCAKAEETVNKLEIEESQEDNKGGIETVSIDLVHLNKKPSLLTAQLEMQSGKNTIVILYKIDTGSEGNIMPLFIFKTTVQKCHRRATAKIHKRPHQAKNI